MVTQVVLTQVVVTQVVSSIVKRNYPTVNLLGGFLSSFDERSEENGLKNPLINWR